MRNRIEQRVVPGRQLARWARTAATSRDRREERVPAERLPLLTLGPARSLGSREARARNELRSLQHRLRVRGLEAAERIGALQEELARTRELLASAEAKVAAGERTPLPSAFRTVQGLSPDAPLFMFKRLFLRELFRRNVEYRRRRRGA